MVKIVQFGGQHRITIPKDIIKGKKWSSKTQLRFVESPDGTILLKEIEEEVNEKRKR